MSKSAKNEAKDTRTRNWTAIVYPESAPPDWRDLIPQMEWACSPLHDRDTNADGTAKKPHWHILLLYSGNKSYEQVLEVTQAINATIPQRIHGTTKGMIRYFAHLDNPDKAQYSPGDIVAYGGLDLADLLRPTSAQRYAMVADMMDYVDEMHITEIADLMRHARRERMDDWFVALCDSCCYVMTQYIRSQRHRADRVDPTTGEVV